VPKPNCVGALIRDQENCVYLQRRSLRRRQLPGAWDIVGGHIEPGETIKDALAREVSEETGWQLRRIEAVVADWEWTHNGIPRRELDFLVEVNGDLSAPTLEPGKHDRFSWVGYKSPDSVRSERDAGNEVLWCIIKRATRIRLTTDLRLEPIGTSSVNALQQLCADGVVALERSALTAPRASIMAADLGYAWERGLSYSWLAYPRKGEDRALGFGSLVRAVIRGSEQLLLQCAVLPGPARTESAVEIVLAMLAFARNELQADRVSAHVRPASSWAREAMDRSGLHHVGVVNLGGGYAELFQISFRNDSPRDLDPDVVTGIGQILVVPS
jgi:8-oxo-dGTP pyrophosphatase MutT (NUDIX family)